MRAERGERAEVAGEQVRLLHQAVERLQRVAAIVGVDAEGFAGGDQQAGDRVVEGAFGEFEGGLGAGAGLADRVMADQAADDGQAGPGMRGQVGLAQAVRRFWRRRRAAEWSRPAAGRPGRSRRRSSACRAVTP